jgi:hypothetical protein
MGLGVVLFRLMHYRSVSKLFKRYHYPV